MKPLKLTVKGLHSFREKQTVDFGTLCDGGVFGIFGPTGSGKSSLLDAMTLALYGKVERAANNTTGIMNHAEDTLAVSFTFQLGHGSRARSYEVERTFKRTGETNIRSATCRFLDVTGEPVVLADKAGDVTRAVEELLGLSIDDFTRAVVLPQGKFSEFLSLKGSERRQMLQRLFNLEKYGDELIKKLKSRLMDTKHNKELIEKEQLGLGEASREMLEQAVKKVQEIEKNIEKEQKKRLYLEEKHQEEKEILKLQKDAEEAEKGLVSLSNKREQILEAERSLKEAQEAANLLPYFREKEEGLAARREAELQKKSALENLEAVIDRKEKAEADWEKWRQEKLAQETPAKLKLEELKRAEEEQSALAEEEKEIRSAKTEAENLKEQLTALEDKFQKAVKDKSRYEDVRKTLKEELESLEIPDGKRKYLFTAVDEKRNIQQAISSMEEFKQDLEKLQLKEKKSTEELKESEQSLGQLRDKLSQTFSQIFQWYERIAEEEREIQRSIIFLEEEKRGLERKHRHILAKSLRESLTEGEPCPVCGSVDHNVSQEYMETESEENGLSETIDFLITDMNGEEREIQLYKWKLEENSAKLKDFVSESEAAAADEQTEPLIKSFKDVSSAEWKEQWEAGKKRLSKEKEAVSRLLQSITDYLQQFEQNKEVLNEKKYSHTGIEERIKELSEKLAEYKRQYEEQVKQWNEKYTDLSFDTADAELEKLYDLEEKAAKHRERIENSTPFIDKKQKEIEEIKEEINRCKVKQSSVTSDISHKEKSSDEKKKRIYEITYGEQPAVLIKSLNESLKKMMEAFDQAEERLKREQEALRNSEEKRAKAAEAYLQAEARLERAEKNWSEQLGKTNFDTEGNVLAASLPDNKQNELAEVIEKHRNEKRKLEIQLDHSLKQLSGRTVTEEVVNKTAEQLQESVNRLNDLQSESGGAGEALKEIEKRVTRFEELEKQREKLVSEYEQLSALDHVFRGKAFVEFLAEEQLVQVSRHASERLHSLTRGRYAIEVDSSGGFVIRDDANGGIRRPVTTLSGGETFLTSLALALSLSASIQLKGEHPLEFFFLDEGFGTLDQELLDTVITALEGLRTTHLSVGVISHVPELRERLPRKLIVSAAEPGGAGSTVKIESM
ncbi:SbcC/MukB-like Walker B domain-containing protein [Evansella clarkii]|uniref:SbcC/MukB-like Walker B domain-containing protein n=1 Tax=Evansella clarkii TaxID=79879 RepID=UPI000B4531EC|nr:SMC family ATPase [Evansella clarkii]